MFCPYRSEENIKSVNSGTFSKKLQEAGVLDIVNRNKQLFEPYGELAQSALLNLRKKLKLQSRGFFTTRK